MARTEQAPADKPDEQQPADAPTEPTEGTDADQAKSDDAPTADAKIVERVGSVDQAVQDADAKRRNDELVEAGTISEAGYIGSDASDLKS